MTQPTSSQSETEQEKEERLEQVKKVSEEYIAIRRQIREKWKANLFEFIATYWWVMVLIGIAIYFAVRN
jgi:hypothetical protein